MVREIGVVEGRGARSERSTLAKRSLILGASCYDKNPHEYPSRLVHKGLISKLHVKKCKSGGVTLKPIFASCRFLHYSCSS